MKQNVKRLVWPILLLALLLPSAVSAAGTEQDLPEPTVINSDITVNTDYTIDENTVVNGQVTILDGELDLDGTVNGDVTVFGGSVDLNGTVHGALVIIGGELKLEEMANIDGECVVIGGGVEVNDSASPCNTLVTGEFDFGQEIFQELNDTLNQLGPGIALDLELPEPPSPGSPEMQMPDEEFAVPPIPDSPEFDWEDEYHDYDHETPFFIRLLGVLGRAVFAGAIGFLFAVVLPQRLVEVTDAVERKPAVAGTIGFFTAIAAMSLLALTSIIWVPVLAILALICGLGILLALGGAAFMGGTVLMGWTAVGVLVGERIAHRLGIEKPGIAAVAAIGSAAVTLGIGMLGLLPFTPDILLGIMILSIGLGGVVLTRFGAQSYPVYIEPDNGDKINRAIDNMPDEIKIEIE
ncbi:MAG: polymer-forming cytoskeletal protein [Ardenticatenaceae bacterium]|nr:polymer-forming cytoskeletal protein [Ardenticatenaceae bacterium]